MNAKASHSTCNLCENPYPYMCNECNGVIESAEPAHLPSLSELTASIPAQAERGLSACRHACLSVGRAAKKPEIVRTWIGSGEDFPFPYSPIGD